MRVLVYRIELSYAIFLLKSTFCSFRSLLDTYQMIVVARSSYRIIVIIDMRSIYC